MTFIIRNQAEIANKYLRFAKWKIRKLSSKYVKLLYSEIYVKKISSTPDVYRTVIKIGVPGPDIVVSAQSKNLNSLWSEVSAKLKRQLRKYSERN